MLFNSVVYGAITQLCCWFCFCLLLLVLIGFVCIDLGWLLSFVFVGTFSCLIAVLVIAVVCCICCCLSLCCGSCCFSVGLERLLGLVCWIRCCLGFRVNGLRCLVGLCTCGVYWFGRVVVGVVCIEGFLGFGVMLVVVFIGYLRIMWCLF